MTRIVRHLRLKPEDRFRVQSNMAQVQCSPFAFPYVQLLSIIQKIGILNSDVDGKAIGL